MLQKIGACAAGEMRYWTEIIREVALRLGRVMVTPSVLILSHPSVLILSVTTGAKCPHDNLIQRGPSSQSSPEFHWAKIFC
jgi:hypothetical protein